MAKRSMTKFDELEMKADVRCRQFWDACSSDALPVPLHELVKMCDVEAIRFERLWSTAGLAKSGERYVIFVNSDAPGATRGAGILLTPDDPGWSDFPPPIRFSIAHEIAHVALYQVTPSERREDQLSRHSKYVEAACSRLARKILLPKDQFIRAIAGQVFNVGQLRGVLRTFAVSPEVLLRRLQLHDLETEFARGDGLVAFVTRRQDQGYAKAGVMWGAQTRSRFGGSVDQARAELARRSPDLSVPAPDSFRQHEGYFLKWLRVHPELDSWIDDESLFPRRLSVRCDNDTELPCEVQFAQLRHRDFAGLLSVRVCGPLTKRSGGSV